MYYCTSAYNEKAKYFFFFYKSGGVGMMLLYGIFTTFSIKYFTTSSFPVSFKMH